MSGAPTGGLSLSYARAKEGRQNGLPACLEAFTRLSSS
jgi:hypothetical protein